MKIEITITLDDFAAGRECPWSGKTCLIAQAAERTLNEFVVASSWSCLDAISQDFEELHGYSFEDVTVTKLMALFDRGHQEDDEAIIALLPYAFTARRSCKYQLDLQAQEYYRGIFTKEVQVPAPPLRILDLALIDDLLVSGAML